jgi:5-(carboxyamino)imidazole ribonucleotide synthase
MVDYAKEISVIVARTHNGEVLPYDPVENIHKNGILDETIAPAEIEENISKQAQKIAIKIANEIDLIGIIAVEMFLTKDSEILINELAPRPHNSGHWTIDASITNQFEQFMRAVCGLPLGNIQFHSKAVMKNLIGDEINLWDKYIQNPNSKLHIYGKNKIRDGRKMGHVTTIKTD